MNEHPSQERLGAPEAYEPPAVTYLGDLADLTQGKEIGGMDGETFLGLDIGS